LEQQGEDHAQPKYNLIDHTAEELGIKRHVLPPSILARDEWASYCSWPPRSPKGSDAKPAMASPIYRGIVPAKNILNRDFAINGAIVRISICPFWRRIILSIHDI
jgi:hypothetical protein